ncbi:LOW QUALITY PROTEIN: hypothetical protein Cgig2_033495 [Carnegiea gigantea]|uniref:Uncharacterized protein n=1 Tax=Carnegiea gigantea TaxID=171969 RepID=A0A9Q1GT29_9CARY|nr:LOW QUALITY PROTEIN: hypothetical protein Cgig2_033495 [Carnegiea gigantea]
MRFKLSIKEQVKFISIIGVMLNINDGWSIDTISNLTPPTIKLMELLNLGPHTIRVTICGNKGLMDNLEDDTTFHYEEDDGIDDRSVNDKEDSGYSLVGKDELFEDSSEHEETWGDGEAVLKHGDMLEDKKHFLDHSQGPKLKALMVRACIAYNARSYRKIMQALYKLRPTAYN